ncbi:hypothetical protein ACIA5G_39525 [Amycolatopsis sp. NPDC051758]|uniref:hypothetical protein n=1 Tax=Amycolatopsis sp. NPDC051758 TaxID=3363935 RepID=UPI0037877C4F
MRLQEDGTTPTCVQSRTARTASAALQQPAQPAVVIDDSTGRQIPAFDGAELAAVHYLPSGYAFESDGFDTQSGLPVLSDESPLAWTRTYTAGVGRAVLMISEAVAESATLVNWPVSGPATVHGHAADVRRAGSSLAITWTTPTKQFAVLALVRNMRTETPLPVEELQRIAEAIA